MSLPVRILVAGIVGGLLVFFTGFVEHAILRWVDREIYSLPEGVDFQGSSKGKVLAPAIYSFPAIPRDNSPAEQQRFADARRTGPSGLIVVAPVGASPMSGSTMLLELATNVFAALIAAWIVSLISAEKTFLWRWKVVVLMAIFGWLSVSASFGIWYRFPWPFIRDDLLCAILEWCVAGAAIAGIVSRKVKEST